MYIIDRCDERQCSANPSFQQINLAIRDCMSMNCRKHVLAITHHPHFCFTLATPIPVGSIFYNSWKTPTVPRNIPPTSHLNSWLGDVEGHAVYYVGCRVCKQPKKRNSERAISWCNFQDRICTMLHSRYSNFNMTSNQPAFHYPESHFHLGLTIHIM